VNVEVPFMVQLSAGPIAIYADGVSTSTITATLTEDGLPVEGMLVTFTTTLGNLSPLTATTDASGVALSTLTSGMLDGTALVTATTTVGSGSVEVEFMPVEPPVKVEVSADPGVIEANGVSTSTITAIVTDVGLPVEGMVVTFTTSLGSLSPITATTDASGVAVVTLTAGTFSGTATVVAAILGDTDAVDVIFVEIGLPETYLPFIVKH
jgi:adhesin/invasin